ncbi:MAG: crossover junction endodeoxyribonuclease RuvC [Gemmatimonadales bacterium]
MPPSWRRRPTDAGLAVKVLGIDPGTAQIGYGLVVSEKGAFRLWECGVLRIRGRPPLPERLREIHLGITELIARHTPDVVAVEDIFFGRNVRTTVTLGHARGVILLAAVSAGLTIAEYPPAIVKKTVVGRGGAQKNQVAYMVEKLLRLRNPPEPADAADGVALALTHLLLQADPRRRLAATP